MTDKTLRTLDAGAAVGDSDLFLTRQGADTSDKSVTAEQMKTYAQGGLSTVATSGSYNDLTDKPSIPSAAAWGGITGTLSSQTDLQSALDAKQATLVSGTNIKTVNGSSILGSGDLSVSGSGEVTHFLMQTGTYTLTSNTDLQRAFNESTNGELTLPTGVYEFECFLYILSMSGTSGNIGFGILGTGTATIARPAWSAVGRDVNGGIAAGAAGYSAAFTDPTTPNIVTAATGTGMSVKVEGVFDVTGAGTIVPSVDLLTATAAVIQAGSYFKCRRIAATGTTASSDWS